MKDTKITFSYIFFSHHPYSEIDRTIHLKLFYKDFYFCARCAGQYLALIIYLIFCIKNQNISIPFWVIIILPAFSTLDWLTQTLKLRTSNNIIRFLTGGIFGIWLGILVHSIKIFNLKLLLLLLVQSVVFTLLVMFILLRKNGCLEEYVKPYEEFIRQYQYQTKAPV